MSVGTTRRLSWTSCKVTSNPQELEPHRRGIGCISFSQWCCSCQVSCNTCCFLRSDMNASFWSRRKDMLSTSYPHKLMVSPPREYTSSLTIVKNSWSFLLLQKRDVLLQDDVLAFRFVAHSGLSWARVSSSPALVGLLGMIWNATDVSPSPLTLVDVFETNVLRTGDVPLLRTS